VVKGPGDISGTLSTSDSFCFVICYFLGFASVREDDDVVADTHFGKLDHKKYQKTFPISILL
jgi:hypothetical protein